MDDARVREEKDDGEARESRIDCSHPCPVPTYEPTAEVQYILYIPYVHMYALYIPHAPNCSGVIPGLSHNIAMHSALV